MYPIEQGAAEIVGYLALTDDDLTIEMDETDETLLEYADPADPDRVLRARLPNVTVRRPWATSTPSDGRSSGPCRAWPPASPKTGRAPCRERECKQWEIPG